MKKLFLSVLIAGAFIFGSTFVHAADTNTTVSSTVVDKAPPTASAPSIVINNSDVCKSAASAAIQTQILGFASGITVTDENCERLKLSKYIYDMAGTPCPYKGAIGDDAKKAWENNPDDVPTDSKVFKKKESQG